MMKAVNIAVVFRQIPGGREDYISNAVETEIAPPLPPECGDRDCYCRDAVYDRCCGCFRECCCRDCCNGIILRHCDK